MKLHASFSIKVCTAVNEQFIINTSAWPVYNANSKNSMVGFAIVKGMANGFDASGEEAREEKEKPF